MKGTTTDGPCKCELASSCPRVLGEYDSRADKLVFKVPAVPSDEWRTALRNFANISESNLRAARGARRKPR